MTNPNPSPIGIGFGLSCFGAGVHNDKRRNPNKINVSGSQQTNTTK